MNRSAIIADEMTTSKKDRDENLDDGIRQMMVALGDNWYGDLHIDGGDPRYANIWSTTWSAMVKLGYIKDYGLKRYDLTASGWLRGVTLLNRMREPQFHRHLSVLSATLKRYVKPRAHDELKDVFTIARDGNVPEAFVRNAISSGLLHVAFNIANCAYFDPNDDNEHLVIIPSAYAVD